MHRFIVFLAALSLSVFAYAANPQVELITNQGRIVLELEQAKAPATVANFLQYVKDKHYDGTIFHRVIDNFMIQGGGFDEKMQQKPTRAPVKNEAANGLKNSAYTIAMARTADPQSASAQFFINVKTNDFLDYRAPDMQNYGYCVFGKVIQGREVIDKIKTVKTGTRPPFSDVPLAPVVIQTAHELPAEK